MCTFPILPLTNATTFYNRTPLVCPFNSCRWTHCTSTLSNHTLSIALLYPFSPIPSLVLCMLVSPTHNHPCAHLAICMTMHPGAHLAICMTMHPGAHLAICMTMHPGAHLALCMTMHPCAHLPICMTTSACTHLALCMAIPVLC